MKYAAVLLSLLLPSSGGGGRGKVSGDASI